MLKIIVRAQKLISPSHMALPDSFNAFFIRFKTHDLSRKNKEALNFRNPVQMIVWWSG